MPIPPFHSLLGDVGKEVCTPHYSLLLWAPSSPFHREDNGRQKEGQGTWSTPFVSCSWQHPPAMHFTQQPQLIPDHSMSCSQNQPQQLPLKNISASQPAPPRPSFQFQLCSFFSKLLGSNNPSLSLCSLYPQLSTLRVVATFLQLLSLCVLHTTFCLTSPSTCLINSLCWNLSVKITLCRLCFLMDCGRQHQ